MSKMKDQCHSGKWPEDEVRAMGICKHEFAICTNGEAHQSLVRTSKCENLLRVSRIGSKDATMGATRDKIIINKNGVSMILDASKGQNKSMMFYLKAKRYSPEGQEALTNLPEKKGQQFRKILMEIEVGPIK